VINSFLVYNSKNNNAKNPHHTTVILSSASTTLLDVEMIAIFEKSRTENRPYLIQLDSNEWYGWIKRRREYWEQEKRISLTYHMLTNSVYVIPMQ